MVGVEEKFRNESSGMAEKHYFDIDFYNYSKYLLYVL